MWYYKEDVRRSLHRYKFYYRRNYAHAYGRLLGMHLLHKGWTDFDLVTWTPISLGRMRKRGYDQGKLLCKAVAKELELPWARTLRKRKNTPAQSTLSSVSARRANVMGAYRVSNPKAFAGKRILLLDDIITTGSTVSECARELLTAGAKEVYCAAMAATEHKA